MQTDWQALKFQALWQAGQALVMVLCTVVLANWFSRRIEGLKAELLNKQTVRNDKRDAYSQVLAVLGQMRHAVDTISISGPASKEAEEAYKRLDDLRKELCRIAPLAVMVLKLPAATALEAYRRISEPALQLDSASPERWTREGKALEDAMKELIVVGGNDLGF
jgi:hypothetical protein